MRHIAFDSIRAGAAGAAVLLLAAAALQVQPACGEGSNAPGGLVRQPAARDPATWPFTPTSPWNHPIGSGARFVAINSPAFRVTGAAGINCAEWSHPVYVASAGDPLRRIYREGEARPAFQARVPEAARPDPEEDGHLHVIDETRRWVVEMWQARRRPNGDLEASACVRNDLTGPGIYPEWHGARAYGGSALGGLIRKGELRTGIPHALAIAVRRSAMNRNGPGGRPYVWPASTADGEVGSGYSASGNLHMGSLLAIPPAVDLRSIGVGDSGPAYEIARALQDYGGYVVDSADWNLILYAEPAAAAELPEGPNEQLAKVIRHLKLVSNNGPQSIGGGGTPRRAFAPPFGPAPIR